MFNGIYEQLINKLIESKLKTVDREQFFVKESAIEKSEVSKLLSQYLSEVINCALNLITDENSIEKQIEVSNKIILLLKDELKNIDFEDDLITVNGTILNAIFSKLDSSVVNYEDHLKKITPFTRLTQSELFTGSNIGISLESELKKEILSSDKIYFLVSFIKWSGIRIFENELREFTQKGNKLKVITTSYMGATDLKAVEFLSGLSNTEVKISYNTENERLHAKSYLFFRNTGFHTGYIGSSNISRSALTSGLEWNLKITTKEIGHIIDKFEKTFETYWQDNEFEIFINEEHIEKLRTALKNERKNDRNEATFYFEIKPFPFQQEILEKLEVERTIHHRNKNLVVAATGTGKTIISAFDFKNYRTKNPNAKFLFVAHRKEILIQARTMFAGVLRENNFGELWVDGEEPSNYKAVFASVMTLKNRIGQLQLAENYYDFIIIDEVHHIAANSYRPILDKFKPVVLLGLTATPERNDGENILNDFCNTIAAEIRLPEAMNRKLLCPFQYFGISDSVDLSNATWQNGRYLPSELSRLYTQNDIRVGEIIQKCKSYLRDFEDVRAIGFCITKEHASYMAEKFVLAGLKADFIVSGNGRDDLRESIKSKFQNKEINYLFVVDIFNEGIDIPEIDTVLFLRPTESLTVFLQQLGRGLRLSENKECLTVLDFVGNARLEYDFEGKFRALIGKTNSSTIEELEREFPHLPLGCSIVLEKKAKEYILDNIKNATQINTNQLINKIVNFKHRTTLTLTLKNFCEFYQIPIQSIYKRGNWSRLCQIADQISDFPNNNEKEVRRTILKKWIHCNSYSYLKFILELAKNNFSIPSKINENKKLMLVMLHYDFWQTAANFDSIEKSIEKIGDNKILTQEIIATLEFLIDRISHIELDIDLPYSQPLKLHSRYTREQILAAFGANTFQKQSSNREGVVNLESKNTELLLVTLEKTEENYSPTTMYNDYAVSEKIFHWQSQNSAKPETGKGLSYITHKENGKSILLFVREKNTDEFGNTMSYVFLGHVYYIEHYGSKPMSIKWGLQVPIPPYIWKETAKMAVG
ncbi:Putative DNA repair helicase RadD [Methanosarcinales archaeon]|nr:Putative DNA repair helicase RadD [Methanosarcinales archaeon]